MPELPSVRRAFGRAAAATAASRRSAGRIGPVGGVRHAEGEAGTRLGIFGRLADRIEQREFLRLRGRFRGRRGLLAFLAVMGPGLIAGIAGNDAGGVTTYSVVGAGTGLTL